MGALDGKVVLVTGGGNGIGRDCALIAAQEGAKVVVNDLGGGLKGEDEGSATAAEKVCEEIRAAGGEAVSNSDSVTNLDAVYGMVELAKKTFGGLHAVINPAGILRDVMFHRMSEQEFDDVVAVHLKGSFNVSRAAAPIFKSQGGGSYVHMTSTSGLIGTFGQANYSAAKLGVAALSKSIALDMQKFGVRSNAVAPFAWTRMVDSIPNETPEQKKRVDSLKKLVPERVAPFVVGLCAEGARDVTGQIFGVRNNEIYLFSQPRPIRSAHRSDGWTPESVVDAALPMLAADFYPLDRSGDVFTWEPV